MAAGGDRNPQGEGRQDGRGVGSTLDAWKESRKDRANVLDLFKWRWIGQPLRGCRVGEEAQ